MHVEEGSQSTATDDNSSEVEVTAEAEVDNKMPLPTNNGTVGLSIGHKVEFSIGGGCYIELKSLEAIIVL